jgi:hypothetical protein
MKYPPGLTIFKPLRLISLYPLFAPLIVFLDLVNAGGSSITTSNCFPSFDQDDKTSKALWHSNLTISCRLLSSEFLVAQSTAC